MAKAEYAEIGSGEQLLTSQRLTGTLPVGRVLRGFWKVIRQKMPRVLPRPPCGVGARLRKTPCSFKDGDLSKVRERVAMTG